MKKTLSIASVFLLSTVALFLARPLATQAQDLEQIKKSGVLRHIGIPYAKFVTGHGTGLDVELMKRFAKHLGVEYRFVQATWGDVFADLTGKKIKPKGDTVEILGNAPIKGDILANGLTILKWRQEIFSYSAPTFPTQVWCLARTDFQAKPIKSSGDIQKDIQRVKEMIKGHKIMGKQKTSLAPGLYGIDSRIAEVINFPGSLNDMAPAIIKGDADLALLDVPDALVALEKWPGKIKVLGPVSPPQLMAVGFRKDSPELLTAFNRFYAQLKKSGEYKILVKKYYPAVFGFYENFFSE